MRMAAFKWSCKIRSGKRSPMSTLKLRVSAYAKSATGSSGPDGATQSAARNVVQTYSGSTTTDIRLMRKKKITVTDATCENKREGHRLLPQIMAHRKDCSAR